jgi:hypothetical protein
MHPGMLCAVLFLSRMDRSCARDEVHSVNRKFLEFGVSPSKELRQNIPRTDTVTAQSIFRDTYQDSQ